MTFAALVEQRRAATLAAALTPAERKLSGTAIQRTIVDAAAALGWRWCHWRAARTTHGWRVPVEGTLGAGWPDIFLAHPIQHRAIAFEVKAYGDELTEAQADVLELLAACGIETFIVGPAAIREPLEGSELLGILAPATRK